MLSSSRGKSESHSHHQLGQASGWTSAHSCLNRLWPGEQGTDCDTRPLPVKSETRCLRPCEHCREILVQSEEQGVSEPGRWAMATTGDSQHCPELTEKMLGGRVELSEFIGQGEPT